MSRQNFNMDDPSEQDKIRRQPHEYVGADDRHGRYVPKPYKHQEYPKMMANAKDFPKPEMKDFRGKPDAQALYEAAVREWDDFLTKSIVQNKQEEMTWLKQNGGKVSA